MVSGRGGEEGGGGGGGGEVDGVNGRRAQTKYIM